MQTASAKVIPLSAHANTKAGEQALHALWENQTLSAPDDATPGVGDRLSEALAALVAKEQVIAEQQLRILELERLATTDPLTGLLNRRGFEETLARALAVSARRDIEYGSMLVLLDLDGFKEINDSHGHAAGDACLQHIGELLSGAVRKSDAVARMGGDEFALLLNPLSGDLPAERLAMIQRRIERKPLVWQGTCIQLRASLGSCAFYPQRHLAPQTLFTIADRALYRDKMARRRQ